MKMRQIEYYRLWAGSNGDSGTWDTDYVDIPIDTPEDKIKEAVKEAARRIEWRDEVPVACGVYAIPDLDDDDMDVD